MVTAINISVKDPKVYMAQLTASVFNKEPSTVTMLATMREITESFTGKDLQIGYVLQVLAKHQKSWCYYLDDLKTWRTGGFKTKVDETAAAVKEAIDAAEKLLIFNLVGVRPGLAAKIQQSDFDWDDLTGDEKKTVYAYDELGFADWSEADAEMFREIQRAEEQAKRDAEWARRKRREKALKENEALKRLRLGISFIATEEQRRSEWTWKSDEDDDD